ncbi:MAG: transposase [Nostoc sp. RI_552]|nr:transposase [Nostoc sp. RI_552]
MHPVRGKFFLTRKVFQCGHCGFECDADVKAAVNIAALEKSVSLRETCGMSCPWEGQLSPLSMIQI